MIKSRTDLDREIDELAAWVPSMLAKTDKADQMAAFAARAEPITDAAGADDHRHVWLRIQGLLTEHCLVPTDEGACE